MKPSHRLVPFVLLVIVPGALQAQHETAPSPPVEGVDYRVYDSDGNASSLSAIVRVSVGSEVLLVGEEHDDSVGHVIETTLVEGVVEALTEADGAVGRKVVVSLEMFERDVQYILDEYLAGVISEEHFLESARPWDDYETRYRPLVEAARARGVPVVAANAPRRYVNRVTREGPESLTPLTALARRYLPPLPYPGPSARYRAQWDSLMAEVMIDTQAEEDSTGTATAAAADTSSEVDHSISGNAIYAQALWDASMGHAIATALVEHLGALVLHFAGSFHVAQGTGIPERIADYRPGTRIVTVVMTQVEDVGVWSAEDHAELADFVVLTRKPGEKAHPGI
jgi:uncharacterized iron-regulated protein